MEKRIKYAIDYCLENSFASMGKIVAMGSSRHGFAILLSMAKNSVISGAVAHQPVIYWPRMREFGGQDHQLVNKYDLYGLVEAFPPRPLMIQTGYNDQRMGQEHSEKLTKLLKKHYRSNGAESHLFHDMLTIPGHDGIRVPDNAIDAVVPWLQRQALI